MPIQYYFDNLEPIAFQRLINALLVARFGENIRLLPLRGQDGGRDAEITPLNTSFEVEANLPPLLPVRLSLERGRYSFQVKHHRMADRQGGVVRSSVVSDFETELKKNVLSRDPAERPNYFFLITNVPSSKESVVKIDEKRRELLTGVSGLHADVLWQEHVVAWLDQSPRVWSAFPDIFAGARIPGLGQVANASAQGLPRSMRLAISAQSKRDGIVRFRQVNFEQSLTQLFVDLDVHAPRFRQFVRETLQPLDYAPDYFFEGTSPEYGYATSCIRMLLSESGVSKRIILEGGPGQGKSTVTQMLAQTYRALLLQKETEYRRIWGNIPKARFPFRIELRLLAEWLGKIDGSIEQYLADLFSRDAGGNQITVDNIHSVVEQEPIILIFDGLDEVGSDDLRDSVIQKISECVERFEEDLTADVRVVVTSRPPAIAGRVDKLPGFYRFPILPLNDQKVTDYVQRWTSAVCSDAFEKERVVESFNKRKSEQHVQALVKNPMQLSVLLHFIRLKGEAFPDRRAELYREYFKTVIDRDVEKSPHLRQNRETIEALHEVIGFEIHSRAESDRAAASLSHDQLIGIVERWLRSQGQKPELARDLFRTSEERLGLVVALKGEGAETRYGFEIQPVREYFAAAFINDKCETDAHDLFPEMVRRSFWREVALFLAGLRRANEKADLLSRARALDDDTQMGWQSDGRTIVMQLLLEGVFTNPGHVFQDATSFLLEYLDPTNTSPKIEPKGLVAAVSQLLRTSDIPESQRQLNDLLLKAAESKDEYALQQLWQVASRSLPASDVVRHAEQYNGDRGQLSSKVKLLWPAEAQLPLNTLLAQQEISQNVTNGAWAQQLFRAAVVNREVTGFESTVKYHELMLEQFAFQHFQVEFGSGLKQGTTEPLRPYAIWRLCSNLRALALRLMKADAPLPPRTTEIDLSGLSESTAAGVSQLVASSDRTLDSLKRGRSRRSSFSEFISSIDELLSKDGLTSWIACRCAVVLLEYSIPLINYVLVGHQRYVPSHRESVLRKLEPWFQVRRKLPAFFRNAIPADMDSAGRLLTRRITELGLHRSCPSHVRIDGALVPVPILLTNGYVRSSAFPYDWLNRVPIPHHWVSDFINADSSLNVLKMLPNRQVDWEGPGLNLSRSAIRSIATAVRDSNDEAFLAGALFALIGSKFWNVIGIPALRRIIQADSNLLDIASGLFDSRGHLQGETPSQRAIQLAELIVRGKIRATKATATAACKFLLDYSAVKIAPLRSLELFIKATSVQSVHASSQLYSR